MVKSRSKEATQVAARKMAKHDAWTSTAHGEMLLLSTCYGVMTFFTLRLSPQAPASLINNHPFLCA